MKTAKGAIIDREHNLERTYVETGPALWRAVYAFSGARRDIADDAVAEAFARALASVETIRDPASWLFRVAFRVAASLMKEEDRQANSAASLAQEAIADQSIELHWDFVSALRRISPTQRAVLFLRFEVGLPTKEIATAMGISTVAVRTHLYRGRRRLQLLLDREEDLE